MAAGALRDERLRRPPPERARRAHRPEAGALLGRSHARWRCRAGPGRAHDLARMAGPRLRGPAGQRQEARPMKRATGHLKIVERAKGPTFYARVRLPDGRQLNQALGLEWKHRSK